MAKSREKDDKSKDRVEQTKKLAAHREAIDTLFDDMYSKRHRVYRLNFWRGVFFGLGSALGGTLVLALVIWGLSFFIDFPVIGDWINNLVESLPKR